MRPPMGEGGRAEELKHPDCRYCGESLRVNLGIMEENRQLKRKLTQARGAGFSEVVGAVGQLLEAASEADTRKEALAHLEAGRNLLAPYLVKEGSG